MSNSDNFRNSLMEAQLDKEAKEKTLQAIIVIQIIILLLHD